MVLGVRPPLRQTFGLYSVITYVFSNLTPSARMTDRRRRLDNALGTKLTNSTARINLI